LMDGNAASPTSSGEVTNENYFCNWGIVLQHPESFVYIIWQGADFDASPGGNKNYNKVLIYFNYSLRFKL
jgi:hypothetical protein